MSTLIGVDVGGTFTDLVYLDEANQLCGTAKVPTTRGNQSEGVLAAIAASGRDLKELSGVIHGTTVATNTLLERNGAQTGIITTRGFRDVLEMRRRDRPQTWGLWGQYEPIVPRNRRLEVSERVLADGTVEQLVDLDEVEAATQALLEMGTEAVAIFFINAYANDSNEQAALERVRALWPNDYVTASTLILPEIREFERCSTATLNAYLQPPVGSYLERLEQGLVDGGCDAELLIVQSNGGVMASQTARALPVRTSLSGPAAGVIASAHIATSAGFPNVITCDMGGTSFDVSLVSDSQPTTSAQTSIDFGMVVRTPMVEITTIGAGGGSIASIDASGLLAVGPQSAGSNPGPACYGLGNDQPTVTDANLLLGRIDAGSPIGGMRGQLELAAAARAVDTCIGKPLGLSVDEAAYAIIQVANARMADAVRLVSIERGHDPKHFTMMPFGGGGALHVGALISQVGLARALVPRYPGVISALGCCVADLRHDAVQTINAALPELDMSGLASRMQTLAEESTEVIKRADINVTGVESTFTLDMLYQGQTHTVGVPVTPAMVQDDDPQTAIERAFANAYKATYGTNLTGLVARVINLKVSVCGVRPSLDLHLLAPSHTKPAGEALKNHRQVYVETQWVDAGVYDRLALGVGAKVEGPAILEQPDATTFLEPGLTATVDDYGNLIVEPNA